MFVFSAVCVRVCGSQSGFSQTLVPFPEPNHWQPSFALNSVPSAWLGDNTVARALDGPYEGPTSSLWGLVSHPRTTGVVGGPWLAPHLVLRGACVVPQELIAHLITVGNTWPFLPGGGLRKRDKKKRRREERGGEQKRENKWVNMT